MTALLPVDLCNIIFLYLVKTVSSFQQRQGSRCWKPLHNCGAQLIYRSIFLSKDELRKHFSLDVDEEKLSAEYGDKIGEFCDWIESWVRTIATDVDRDNNDKYLIRTPRPNWDKGTELRLFYSFEFKKEFALPFYLLRSKKTSTFFLVSPNKKRKRKGCVQRFIQSCTFISGRSFTNLSMKLKEPRATY